MSTDQRRQLHSQVEPLDHAPIRQAEELDIVDPDRGACRALLGPLDGSGLAGAIVLMPISPSVTRA